MEYFISSNASAFRLSPLNYSIRHVIYHSAIQQYLDDSGNIVATEKSSSGTDPNELNMWGQRKYDCSKYAS
jgi:hypothetical protein